MYIIIRGPLGIGKTTIAKKLATILKAEYISIDSLLDKHNLNKVDKNKGISLKNFIKANKIIILKIRKKLAKAKIVILDGCFYHKEQIEHFIRHLPEPYYVFTLKAPLEVCIKRDSKRKKVYGKDAAKAVFKLGFDYGTLINADKTVDEVVKEILCCLAE